MSHVPSLHALFLQARKAAIIQPMRLSFVVLAIGLCSSSAVDCPAGVWTRIADFVLNGTQWTACEDIQRRDGALALVSSDGPVEWFEKGYEPYTQVTSTIINRLHKFR